MSFSIGIVGLPNVGKSTLFNALTDLQVPAENYPFTTIEPNVGVVAVPDERLEKLAALEKPEKIIPTTIKFVDIAGLVKNAHQGAGLGNQFLSHIREVDAIAEVVRVFEDKNVAHLEGLIDPKRDIETLETELKLADLQMIEKMQEKLISAAKSGSQDDVLRLGIAQKYFEALSAGQLAIGVEISDEERLYLHEFPLLTLKPVLYVINATYDLKTKIFLLPNSQFLIPPSVPLDAKLEFELSQLPETERKSYLAELGLAESGLAKLIKAAGQILNLITFFTRQSQILQAWTCKAGTKAPEAAGIIHTDFKKGFIKAEVLNWEKLIEAGSWIKARDQGLLKQAGKEYLVQDGEVIHFKTNA